MGYKSQALRIVFYWLTDCNPALQDFVPFVSNYPWMRDCLPLRNAIDDYQLRFWLHSVYDEQRAARRRLIYAPMLSWMHNEPSAHLTEEELDALLE